MKFVNQTSKTLEIDESEAGHHESESLRFVEFAVQFVREIRKIRLHISPVEPTAQHHQQSDALDHPSNLSTHTCTSHLDNPAPRDGGP